MRRSGQAAPPNSPLWSSSPAPSSSSGLSNTSERRRSPERFLVYSTPLSPQVPPHRIPLSIIPQTLYYKENGRLLSIPQNIETVRVGPYTLGILENNMCIPMYTRNGKNVVIDNRTRGFEEITEQQAASLGIGKPVASQKLKKERSNQQKPN